MMRVLHHHRKVILWAMMILIVPAFVVWGGYVSSGPGSDEEMAAMAGAVARVGSVPLQAEAFRTELASEAQRRAQYGDRPSFQDLALEGAAIRVLDRLIEGAVLDNVEAQREFRCKRDFLAERLKGYPMFQTEDGQLDVATWNAFIDSGKDRNWAAIYADVNRQVGREVHLEVLKASARILGATINETFDENHSTLRIKRVVIEPPIEPTEEQIQAQYDEDPTVYQIPEHRVAQFVAVSLVPPQPPLVDDLVERARAGEDFAELAKAHSDWFGADRGGVMSWVAERPDMPDHLRPVLALAVGEVSDPVPGSNGYFIYKAEEERTNEETGLREVKGRQIHVRPQLTEEERADRQALADGLRERAVEQGDLAVAAAEAGLEVQTSEAFSSESTEIEAVPRTDVRGFKGGFEGVGADEFAEVIAGRENLYVAKVIELEPPVIQPLDAVRDRVEKDAVETIKQSEEYAERVDTVCREIAAKAASLADIPTLFPDLGAEIVEPKPFTTKESPIVPGTALRSQDLYQRFKDKGPGALVGPLDGRPPLKHFVELVALDPPSEEEWGPEKRYEEEKSLRENALMMAQYGRMSDYIKFSRERTRVEIDDAAFALVIGSDPRNAAEEALAE